MENKYLHEIAMSAIIQKDGKYLIARRSLEKTRLPGKWTVPGGRLETNDYIDLPRDTGDGWYGILEKTLKREVKEEVGVDIENINYLTNLVVVNEGGAPGVIISCTADYAGGEIKLQMEENDDFAWVDLDEAKKFDLIDGIYAEMIIAHDKKIKN